MGAQLFVLQVIAATFVSVCVGVIWYTPMLFGRLWWSIQFPGRKFGDGVANSTTLPFLCAASYLLQNSAIVVLMNWMLQATIESTAPVPLLVAVVMVTVNAAANFPHYLYGRQPIHLYAIYCGHDVVQLVAATTLPMCLRRPGILSLVGPAWCRETTLSCHVVHFHLALPFFFLFFFLYHLNGAAVIEHLINLVSKQYMFMMAHQCFQVRFIAWDI